MFPENSMSSFQFQKKEAHLLQTITLCWTQRSPALRNREKQVSGFQVHGTKIITEEGAMTGPFIGLELCQAS